jgi:hypothetical protein
MAAPSKEVDAYIENAAEFARPLLRHWRALIHKECPDAAETTKWGMPFFTRKALLSNMAAFKAHCAFGFWHGAEVSAAAGFKPDDEAMGLLGRVTSLADFPPDKVIARLIREAVILDDAGFKKSSRPVKPKPALVVPDDLAAALKTNAKARAAFEAFPPSHKREYVEWLTEAKREETRKKRLAQALEQMAEGKSRYAKYANC